ncbi:MAG: zinc ribbon domain-containing protein [Bryobacterales bacterium]|nr:zinc ribbon domain-containing protein [Bryobacterales bacterium]
MPLYEYRCPECGARFEQLRRMTEADSGVVCPRCESQRVQRLFSTFATGGCTPTAGGGFT